MRLDSLIRPIKSKLRKTKSSTEEETQRQRQPRRVPAYPYQKLEGTDIRLLQILPGSDDDEIECVLDLVPLDQGDQDRTLCFGALSYVWGDPTDTEDIILEGQPFTVTGGLYSALYQLRQLDDEADCFEYYWADAICINQDDLDEKSIQVPRMSDIYAKSFIVIIWLGLPSLPEQNVVKRLSRKIASISYSVISRKDMRLGQLSKASVTDRAIENLFRMAKAFSDEALTEEDEQNQLIILHRHLETLSRAHQHLLVLSGWSRLDRISQLHWWNYERGYELRHELLEEPEDDLKGMAELLLKVIMLAGGKTSTHPVDQIYGILGLAKSLRGRDLPAVLTPNYHLSFEDVYWQYTVFILEHAPDLRLFRYYKNDLQNVPSWVPDFRYLVPTNNMPQMPRPQLSISPDRRSLQILGLKLAAIQDSLDAYTGISENGCF
ncbi:heterokaryon incompatibility protein-domain-containing protein [Whalleya microplaca]|nr:heterokaryon incompatibility protein-domain-containing protein [Whalleya microplaca]